MSNVIPTIKSVVKLSVADKAKIKAQAAKLKAKRDATLKAKNAKSVDVTVAKLTTNEALHKYVLDHGKMEGSARVMYHKIADETGMRDWPTLTAANARGNERAVWEKLEEMRKVMQAASEARGLGNKDKPWSDVKAIGRQDNPDSVKREGKSVETRYKLQMTALYKAGMREQRPTERELAMNADAGRFLMAHFKIDLSTLG